MFAAILGPIISSIANTAIGKIADAFTAYQNKQISVAELEAKVKQAQLDSYTEIEKSANETLAKTYDSFTKALAKSPLLQAMWAAVVGSQLFVLVWHQLGIPFVVFMGWAKTYPSSGTTVEWAYLLLAGCLGMGPVVLRNGPGAGAISDQLKILVGKK